MWLLLFFVSHFKNNQKQKLQIERQNDFLICAYTHTLARAHGHTQTHDPRKLCLLAGTSIAEIWTIMVCSKEFKEKFQNQEISAFLLFCFVWYPEKQIVKFVFWHQRKSPLSVIFFCILFSGKYGQARTYHSMTKLMQ